MANVVRAITRLQDADDFSGSLTDTYIPVWSNALQKFVMTAQSTTPPGGSNTHVQRNNGSGGFAGDSGFTYNGSGVATLSAALVVPAIKPASNSTTALQLQNASGTAVVTVDTTSGRVGIGTTPTVTLDVNGNISATLNGTSRMLLGIYFPGGQLGINTTSDFDWSLARNSQERFRFFSAWSTLSGGNGERTLVVTSSGLIGLGNNTSPTAFLHILASTTSYASLRIPSGTAPTSPNDGDVWYPASGRLTFRRSTTSEIFATGVQATGGAATAGASWTSTEQTMLQKVYDVARIFGLLS